MYPVHDNDRRNGSNCPVLMISSENWSLTKHQAPFRKDFKENTIKKSINKLHHHNHHHHHHSHQHQHHVNHNSHSNNHNSHNNSNSHNSHSINSSFYHPFLVTILGSDHLNYCDMVYLTSPILMTRDNYLGKTNPYQLLLAKDYLILRFFAASSFITQSTIHKNNNMNDQLTKDLKKVDSNELSPLHNQPDNISSIEISVSPQSSSSSSSFSTSYSPISVNQNETTDVERLFHYCHISSSSIPSNQSSSISSKTNDIYDWSVIEDIPENIHQYLVKNLVDESSLPHCFDDTYFNQLTNNQETI